MSLLSKSLNFTKCLKRVKNVAFFNTLNRNSHQNVIRSRYPDMDIPKCTLTEFIWRDLDKWPEKTALTCGLTGQSYTYTQVQKMCTTLAASLRNKLKLENGDCIALMLPNCPEFPIAAIAAAEAGCIVTTINPAYVADEISRQFQISKTKAIVTMNSCYGEVKKALDILKMNIPVIVTDAKSGLPESTINFTEFATDPHRNVDCLKNVKRVANDTLFLPFSSGTLGLPKGVELSNSNIVANCLQGSADKVAITFPSIGNHQDVLLSILPFFHIYGLTVTLLQKLSMGSHLVTLPKFTSDSYLNAQEKYKSNVLYLAPPLVLFLTSHPSVKEIHLDPVRYLMSGAAPLSDSDIHRFLQKAKNVSFMQGFGMTETSPACMILERGSTNYASVGCPLPNTESMIVDVDDESKSLEPNKQGELWVRGPQVMKGYLSNPEANQDIFRPGNWLRTGDLAYYDENNDIYITDRLKELIKVKGYQVAPAELEGIIRCHPDVMDVAVVGGPHPQNGETPKAFVVKRKDSSPSAEDIMEYVAGKVSSYKKIGDVIFIDSVPKSAAGKILRREVKKKFVKYF